MSILQVIVRSIVMLIVLFKKKYTGYQYCDKTGRNLWSTHIVLSAQLEHPGIHTSAKHFIVTNNVIDRGLKILNGDFERGSCFSTS